jgi:multidrug efflux pump subunit AcrA (membrane-fusion protein)
VVRPLLVLAVPALVLAVAACSRGGPKAEATPPPAVSTVTASNGTIYPSLQIAGVIAPFRQVGVAANLSEPIKEVDVQAGDRVRGGQVLARLVTDDLEAQLAASERTVTEDVARYRQTVYQVNAVNAQDLSAIRSAQATLHQAQVNLAGAVLDLRRYESLLRQGYLPQQTVDEQRTTVSSDRAAVSSALAAVNQAIANARANGSGANAGEQQQELAASRDAADAAEATTEQLRRQIARAVIVAPVDGIVDAVNANPGEYPTGRELFTIEQNANVYAVLPSSTSQVVQIRNGAAATVIAAGSTRHDAGKVVAVLDQVQPGTTNFTVKVLVANSDGHLHAGMPVTGTVDLPPVHGVVIPVTAFVDDTHTSVYVVSNGSLRTQRVSEVQTDNKNAVVIGLPAGYVVVKNVEASDVGNGDRVTVTPTASPPTAAP